MIRQDGFYWVKYRFTGAETVAEWFNASLGGSWFVAGTDMDYDDDHFIVLSDRLPAPSEKKKPLDRICIVSDPLKHCI